MEGKARGRTHWVSPVDSTFLGLAMLLRGGSPGGMVGVEEVEGPENIPSNGFLMPNFWQSNSNSNDPWGAIGLVFFYVLERDELGSFGMG